MANCENASVWWQATNGSLEAIHQAPDNKLYVSSSFKKTAQFARTQKDPKILGRRGNSWKNVLHKVSRKELTPLRSFSVNVNPHYQRIAMGL